MKPITSTSFSIQYKHVIKIRREDYNDDDDDETLVQYDDSLSDNYLVLHLINVSIKNFHYDMLFNCWCVETDSCN